MRVLVFGASGMLGHAVVRHLAARSDLQVFGTVRTARSRRHFPAALQDRILPGIDVERQEALLAAFTTARPDVVINCVGIIKQLSEADDVFTAIPLNVLLPHRLADLCRLVGARLVHISTDCVFSGDRGHYVETDLADAADLYGRSKLLGEVRSPHTITLRTSIIGHELESAHSLLEWFLAQETAVEGYRQAIFSGLPTNEVARVIGDYVIPNRDLAGLYHLSAEPISKYELLRLIADRYGKIIDIRASDRVRIDRSLDSSRFRSVTGFRPDSWPTMIDGMYRFFNPQT